MSADNYYTVKFNQDDLKTYVIHGFMSDDYPATIRPDAKGYDSYDEAVAEAHRLAGDGYGSEYGVIEEDGDFNLLVTDEQVDGYARKQIEKWTNWLKWRKEGTE